MKKINILLFAGFLIIAVFSPITAENDTIPEQKIKLSGYGYYMFGQFVSGVIGGESIIDGEWETFKHLWSNVCLTHLNVNSDLTEWFTARLGLELSVGFYLNNSAIISRISKSTFFRKYNTYLISAEGIMHWNFEHLLQSSLKIETGLFPFTTNSQVKTLGNYLFRSSIHPPSIQNKMDYPWAEVLGGNAEVGLFENKITFEAMIASEFIYVPFFDFTPAFGLNYQPNEFIDIGGAIAFNHAIQANPAYLPDSIDEKWHGTKIDLKAIFDPKPLFGGMPFFEKDQFKIYAELAFLGLDDQLEVDTNNLSELRAYEQDT